MKNRYGIEGIVYSKVSGSEKSLLKHDPDHATLTCPSTNAVIRLFGKVKVRVIVEEAGHSAAQRSKLVVKLVSPYIPNLSVDGIEKE